MTEQGKKNIVWGVFIAFIVALVWGAWGYSSYDPEGDAKRLAQGDIAFCWAKYNRNEVPPSENVQVGAKCFDLERQFESRFGAKP